MLFTCKQPESNKTEEVKKTADSSVHELKVYNGQVLYEAVATSDNPDNVHLFYQFSPVRINIYFQNDQFRLIEEGGLSNGNIIIDATEQKAWQLDTVNRIAFEGVYSDFDNASETLKQQMPDHFAPLLESTGEHETILGYKCEKFAVLRSGFVPKDSEAFIWVSNEFQFPHARYDVQTAVNHVTSPLPLTLGNKNGAVLKMEIDDSDTKVIYTATKLDTQNITASLFKIPDGYTVK